MAKLSAFADEVTDDFLEQVKYLASEKVGYIEPRFLNKKNIMDLNKAELDEARKMIEDMNFEFVVDGADISAIDNLKHPDMIVKEESLQKTSDVQ